MFFNSCFIWTDCLGNPNNVINELNYFINTFDNLKLNVFTFEEDIYLLPQHKNIIYHKFPKTNFIIDLMNQFLSIFKNSFIPSERILRNNLKIEVKLKSILWAYIFKKYSKYPLFIYFDCNEIESFGQSIFGSLMEKTNTTDLVIGKKDIINQNNYRKQNKNSLKNNICFFLLKPSLVPSIRRLSQYSLFKFIEGKHGSRNNYVYRFFDKISNELISNGGLKYELEINNYLNF